MRQMLLAGLCVVLTIMISGATLAEELKEELLGVWPATSIVRAGKAAPPEAVALMRLTFRKDELLVRGNFQDEREVSCKYKIDSTKSPVHFEFLPPGAKNPVLGILRLEKGKLEICMRNANHPKGRPESFAPTEDTSIVLMRFERTGAGTQ